MKTDVKQEDQTNIFFSAEYKRSRSAYVAQCTFEYFVSLCVTDAFLAKLLTNVGFSDTLIGIISSFISFAFLFQLLAVIFAGKITNTKKTVIFFDTLSQIFFMAIYVIPFIPISKVFKMILIIGCILIAYVTKYFIASIFFKWANSYVEPTKRGVFSAGKEMISLAAGIVFSLAIGYVIDRYEALDNIQGGFLFIAASMLVLNICNFISLLMIKSRAEKQTPEKHKVDFRSIFKNTMGNRNFVTVVVMYTLWDIARYLSIGFMGTFKTNDLLLTVGAVQLINMAASLFRLLVSKPFGRYSDRKSYTKGVELAFIIAAIGFAINVFTSNKTWWCIIAFTVLYNVSFAGTNQNGSNIVYSYVKEEYVTYALAIKNSISGIFGFLASLLGGKILAFIQINENSFLGIGLYGQQLLSALSCLILVFAILFNHFVVAKQKVMIQ